MPDIFLYTGEPNRSDIKLRDPTMVAGGGVTIPADLAVTEAPDTAAFAATRISVASLTATEAPDVAAFAATHVHTAALAASEAPDVAAFSGTLVHVADLAATEAPDVLAFAATLIPAAQTITADLAATEAQDVASFAATLISATPAAEDQHLQPAGKPARDVRRRLYIMPDGRRFEATTDEVLQLLQLYAVPKESIAQLTEAPKVQPVIRAPQITLQKRDVRFVPAEQPNTYKAVISERFVYRAPPEATGHAEMLANRIRADEEALLLLL